MNSIKKALLVDDTEIDLYITRCLMEAGGFADEILTRTSAMEALAYLRINADNPEQLPDVIFLDIRMPVMDGFGFLEQFELLSESIRNHCTIYMLSSSLDYEDLARAHCNPFVSAFLNKPLYPETLLNLKCQLLQRSSLNNNKQ
ncbi:MAG: response regulator [Bacteroidota bacterium]